MYFLPTIHRLFVLSTLPLHKSTVLSLIMPLSKQSRKKANTFSSLHDDSVTPPSIENELDLPSSPKTPPSDSDLLRELCSTMSNFTLSVENLGKDFENFKIESATRTQHLETGFDTFLNGHLPLKQSYTSTIYESSPTQPLTVYKPPNASASSDYSRPPPIIFPCQLPPPLVSRIHTVSHPFALPHLQFEILNQITTIPHPVMSSLPELLGQMLQNTVNVVLNDLKL